MQTSDGGESCVLRDRDIRGESEDVPSQTLCVYLNGPDDRDGKAEKGSSDPK